MLLCHKTRLGLNGERVGGQGVWLWGVDQELYSEGRGPEYFRGSAYPAYVLTLSLQLLTGFALVR